MIRNICLAIALISLLLAIGPSLFGEIREQLKSGKPRGVDCSGVFLEIRDLCQSMGVTKDIKVKIVPTWRNAESKFSTIRIGEPILGKFDKASRDGMLGHELAHIKRNHSAKKIPILIAIIILLSVIYLFVPLQFTPFTFLVLSFGIVGIASRFMTWPFEYEADVVAAQHLGHEAVESFLRAVADIRQVDIQRDFYFHPSIANRIANLGWSRQTRFKKWYFEL